MIMIEFFTEEDVRAVLENRATERQMATVFDYLIANPHEFERLIRSGPARWLRDAAPGRLANR